MSVYMVWVVDCENCGDLIAYGEDESTIPEKCETCGWPTEKEE